MAKKSAVNRNNKRIQTVANQEERRMELKKTIKDLNASYEDKMAARDALNKMSRDGCAIRVQSRCQFTGRPHSVYKKYGICRNVLREMASRGALPGVSKSSW
ncbi:MAG: 30S ribosomal protein S14 [Alphaproteobacteria bacterium]|nr:30S ribosomal protein S14 [Alphaproteobacteria bacterium]